MPKPVEIPVWSTATNFPAGAEAFSSTPTKVQPVSGLIATGWSPKQKPAAQNQNYWQNLVGQWITWDTRTRTKTFSAHSLALSNTNWGYAVGGYASSSGVGIAYLDLELDVGDRPRDINFLRYGNAADDLTVTVRKTDSAGVESTLATLVIVDPAASFINSRINFAADTGLTTMFSDGVGYGRTVGNFITDGFTVGMTFVPSGFTNAGNNTTPRTIASMSATTIAVTSSTGMVNEPTGTGDERFVVTPPTVGAGESFYMAFTSTGGGGGRVGATTMSFDDGSVL